MMVFSDQQFDTITDVAEGWGVTNDYLLHWGAKGKIRLSFYSDSIHVYKWQSFGQEKRRKVIELKNTFLHVTPQDIDKIFTYQSAAIQYVEPTSADQAILLGWSRSTDTELVKKIDIHIADLVVLHPEQQRFEETYSALLRGEAESQIMGTELLVQRREETLGVHDLSKINPGGFEQILNPQHPWHSEPLANAIKAWLSLYEKREGDKHDNRYRPKKGNTKYIKKWLRENVDDRMGRTTSQHYTFIINPSKQGGPSKLSE